MSLNLKPWGVRMGLKRSQRFDSNVEGSPSGYPAEQPPYLPVPQQGYVNVTGDTIYTEQRQWDLDGTHGRIPRLFNRNLAMLAGLSSMDASRQWEHTMFLPPMEPMQRGGDIRAVAGGSNRASSNAGSSGAAYIPGVFVPVGRA